MHRSPPRNETPATQKDFSAPAVVGEEDPDTLMYKETARLISKRQTIYKTKYEAEAKLQSRNKALIALVKVPGITLQARR